MNHGLSNPARMQSPKSDWVGGALFKGLETNRVKHVLVVLALAMLVGCASHDEATWSAPVNGLRARLIVLPSETNRTPFCRVLIEMQNVADVAGQLKIRFNPDRLKLRVTDQAGKELQVANGSYDGSVPLWDPTLLPMGGTIKFRISFPGLGYHPDTDKVIVDVGPLQAWVIPQDGSTYWLSGNLVIDHQVGDHPYMDWSGTLELPKVAIPKAKTNPGLVGSALFQGLEPETGVFSKHWKISHSTFPGLGKFCRSFFEPWKPGVLNEEIRKAGKERTC